MKLASYKDGSRDGQLLVVSGDLSTAHYATGIATRLQQVLDDWNFLSPQLQELAQTLDHGKARHAFAFDPRRCTAPLPRAFLLAGPDGTDPAQPGLGRGDRLLGPADPLPAAAAPPGGWPLQGQLAAITGDIPAGASAAEALDGIRLVMFTATLDAAVPGLRAFAPVAVTPDELGSAWQGGTATLSLRLQRQGEKPATAALAAGAPLGELLAALAARHGLRAGSIVCSGPGRDSADAAGWSAGEEARLEALDAAGHSVFGPIAPATGTPRLADAPPAETPAD